MSDAAAPTLSEGTAKPPASEDAQSSWAELAKRLMEHDRNTAKTWEKELDTLLVFAGLFSAALTAFNIELYGQLSPDPAQSTVILLSQISQQLSSLSINGGFINSTVPPIVPSSEILQPEPSRYVVHVNALWFSSLVLSLATASLAMLVKQWLREYMMWMPSPTKESVTIRSLRFQALDDWRVFQIATLLPTLLQVAFVLFLLGLIELLRNLNDDVANIVTCISSIFLLVLVLTTFIPAFFTACPFRSPQSSIARVLCNIVILSMWKVVQPGITCISWRNAQRCGAQTRSQTIITTHDESDPESDHEDETRRHNLWSKLRHKVKTWPSHWTTRALSWRLGWREMDAARIKPTSAPSIRLDTIKWALSTFSDSKFTDEVIVPIARVWDSANVIEIARHILNHSQHTRSSISLDIKTIPENNVNLVRVCITAFAVSQSNPNTVFLCATTHLKVYEGEPQECPHCANFVYALRITCTTKLFGGSGEEWHRMYAVLAFLGLGSSIERGRKRILRVYAYEVPTCMFGPLNEESEDAIYESMQQLKIDDAALCRILGCLSCSIADELDEPDERFCAEMEFCVLPSFYLALFAARTLRKKTQRSPQLQAEVDAGLERLALWLGKIRNPDRLWLLSWAECYIPSIYNLVKVDKSLWTKNLTLMLQACMRSLDSEYMMHPCKWSDKGQRALEEIGAFYKVKFDLDRSYPDGNSGPVRANIIDGEGGHDDNVRQRSVRFAEPLIPQEMEEDNDNGQYLDDAESEKESLAGSETRTEEGDENEGINIPCASISIQGHENAINVCKLEHQADKHGGNTTESIANAERVSSGYSLVYAQEPESVVAAAREARNKSLHVAPEEDPNVEAQIGNQRVLRILEDGKMIAVLHGRDRVATPPSKDEESPSNGGSRAGTDMIRWIQKDPFLCPREGGKVEKDVVGSTTTNTGTDGMEQLQGAAADVSIPTSEV